MTFTKDNMTEHLYSELGLNKREARELVDLFFESIRSNLAIGKSVKLAGFGSFILRDKSQRPGRNPHTGETVPISARRVILFRPSQKLRDRIDKNRYNHRNHLKE